MATLHLYGGAMVSEKPISFHIGMHGRQFHVVCNCFPSGARRDIFPLGTNMVSGVKEMALPKSIHQILEMRQMVEIYEGDGISSQVLAIAKPLLVQIQYFTQFLHVPSH